MTTKRLSGALRPLVDAAREVAPLGLVLADAEEFDSEQRSTAPRA